MKQLIAGHMEAWAAMTLPQQWAAVIRKYGTSSAQKLETLKLKLVTAMDALQDFDEYAIVHREVNAACARAGQPNPELTKVNKLIGCVGDLFSDEIKFWKIQHPELVDQTFDSLAAALEAADKSRIRPTKSTVTMESYTGVVAEAPPSSSGLMSIEQITAISTSVANAILAGAAPTNNGQPWTNRGGRGGQARGNGREGARGRGNAGRGGRGRGLGSTPLPIRYCHSHGWCKHPSSQCNDPYPGHIFQDGVINTRYHESSAPNA